MRPDLVSHNSSANYAAATDEFNVSLIASNTTNTSSLDRDSCCKRFPNGQWQAEYLSPTVNFGDLILSVGNHASYINLTSTTNLNVSKDGLPNDFKLTGPIEIPLSEIVLNITDWIDVTNVVSDIHDSTNGRIYASVVAGCGIDVPTKSRIQLSKSFLMIVIVCSTVKPSIKLWVLYVEKTDFMVTLGDAAASFVENRGPTTVKFLHLQQGGHHCRGRSSYVQRGGNSIAS
ncbi:hypothetical protein DPSP01_002681 [Paraphaeosphaeria sporulosa]